MVRIYLDPDSEPSEELVLEIRSEDLQLAVSADYFRLEGTAPTEARTYVLRRVASLLIQWVRHLKALPLEGHCYLPFDFDPQLRHIGCFRVKRLEGDQLLILYGYTAAFAGRPLPPEKALDFDLAEHEFIVDPSYEIFFASLPELRAGLEASIQELLAEA
ncbi:MAG: hypothetical protein SFY70_05360 [Bacteroidia bacterium]|nr:hypothetical protein [Bacteroidia bacterium]